MSEVCCSYIALNSSQYLETGVKYEPTSVVTFRDQSEEREGLLVGRKCNLLSADQGGGGGGGDGHYRRNLSYTGVILVISYICSVIVCKLFGKAYQSRSMFELVIPALCEGFTLAIVI